MEIKKQQVFIRAIYFFYLAGLSCLMPYLPVFMRHKGLSESQVGLVRGTEAIALVLFTPLWGYMASKITHHKVLLLVTLVAATIFAFCILFIPSTLSPIACFSHSSCTFTNLTTNFLLPYGAEDLVSTNEQFLFCNKSTAGNFTTKKFHTCRTIPPTLCKSTVDTGGHFVSTQSRQVSEICIWSSLNLRSPCQEEVVVVESPLPGSKCSICCMKEDPSSSSSYLCCDNSFGPDSVAKDGNSRRTFNVWSNWITFLLIAVLLLMSSFFRCGIFPILDATSMELLEGSRIRYNKERLWGSVGWGIFALLSGMLLDVTSLGDFSTCFYLSVSLTGVATVSVGCLRFPDQSTVQNANSLNRVLYRAEVLVFFLLALVMGFSFGIVGTYLLLYLEDLQGPYSLMGLTMTLSCLSEVPFLYISGTIAQHVGHHGIILIALVCYTLRFVAYSFINMPWLVIPFELLHGITYGASWAGCSFYANHIAPSGLANSLLKIFTALYMGLGKGLGALIGGFIYEYLGAKFLFRFAALVSVVGAVLYFIAITINKRRETDYKRFVDTLDDQATSSTAVPMEPHPRHQSRPGGTPGPDHPPSSIHGRKRSMHLPLQDIYQPEEPSFQDQDQECLLSSEVTPPDLRVMRLEFQPPPDWLKGGRSYGGTGGPEGKKELEVRLDAIGSEGDPSSRKRKGTLTSLV